VIVGCVVYGIQLGWGNVVSWLVYLTSSGFSSVLFFSVGVCFASGIHCVCVCVCVCVSLAHLVYTGSGFPFLLWGSCFWCVCACSPPSVVSVL